MIFVEVLAAIIVIPIAFVAVVNIIAAPFVIVWKVCGGK